MFKSVKIWGVWFKIINKKENQQEIEICHIKSAVNCLENRKKLNKALFSKISIATVSY